MADNRDVVWTSEATPGSAVSTPDPAGTAPRDAVTAGEGRDEASNVPPHSGTAAAATSSRAASQRRVNEWSKAKDSFVSIMDEAGAAIRVFDQEKRRILGLTHALTQIQQSFEALHTRFGEIETGASTAAADRKRLDQRLDETAAAVRGCEDNEAELLKDNAALRAALAQIERRMVQHAETIVALAEENRKLRERQAAMDRDGGLIVDEIARIRNELITLNERGCEAEAVERRSGDVGAPMQDSRFAAAHPTSGPAPEELAEMVGTLADALEAQRTELGRLKGRIDGLPPAHQVESSRRQPSHYGTPGAGARAGEIVTRAAATSPPAKVLLPTEMPDAADEPGQGDYPQLQAELAASEDATAADDAWTTTQQAARDDVDVNALCSVFEKRSIELRSELLRERQERQFIENALQAARSERAHLQRELARLQLQSKRRNPPPEDSFEPPLDPPEPANHDFTAARARGT